MAVPPVYAASAPASMPISHSFACSRSSNHWQTSVLSDVLALEREEQDVAIAVVGVQGNPPRVAPLQPITVTLTMADYEGVVALHVFDAALRSSGVVTVSIHNGFGKASLLPRGVLGPQSLVVVRNRRVIAVHEQLFTLDAQTTLATGHPDLDAIYPMVRQFMQQDTVDYELDGLHVHGYRSPDNPLLWLRDHVYQGRGFRYFDPDVVSLLDAFRRTQRPDGSFWDVLPYPARYVSGHRLETESDLEFLFVQGVYEAWQATGDDAWLRTNMDAMRRGLFYSMSDPQRWNDKYGLLMRPYTIDTWDFQFGPTTTSPEGMPAPRHWIDEATMWGIFHGDNTGLAYALKLMERMEQELGNAEEAFAWRVKREPLMKRLNALSWNGPFFTHFVLPDGSVPDVPGVDTAAQVSLSNAYALNRDVLSFEQGRAIIETYYKRRDFERAFAEWYSIDPPFPSGSFGMAGGKGEEPGEYVNGGIMPLVGGELARGAFTFGSETFGFDILQRYAALIRLTGASYLWYYPDGRPGISSEHTLSTDGWGSSAMLGALIEGAAGVEDRSSTFRQINLSPRWGTLADMRSARVVVRYAASDGYVAYIWHYEPQHKRLCVRLTGSWKDAEVRLLLPADGRNVQKRTLFVNGYEVPFEKKKFGSGQYIVFDVDGGNADMVLEWVK